MDTLIPGTGMRDLIVQYLEGQKLLQSLKNLESKKDLILPKDMRRKYWQSVRLQEYRQTHLMNQIRLMECNMRRDGQSLLDVLSHRGDQT